MQNITFGVLTVSDTCAVKPELDKSGAELRRLITEEKTFSGVVLVNEIVADDEMKIIGVLGKWCGLVQIIITTGGTGFSPRDVTPEATKAVIKKEAPGLALAMLNAGLNATPTAMLSRLVCGICDETLIINMPGSTKAVRECYKAIYHAIPHAVDLLMDQKPNIQETHELIQSKTREIKQEEHSCGHEKHFDTSFLANNVANRPRNSPFPMISVEDALKIINQTRVNLKTEYVDLWQCHGHILLHDVFSDYDLPPFRASIKDGYAVIASDTEKRRQVMGGIAAGQMPATEKLSSGYCVRVNTGAPIPHEATAVVQVEDTEILEKDSTGQEEIEIKILVDPVEGQDIRPIGSDIRKGDFVLQKYTQIGAVEMGVLAACGRSQEYVFKKPIVGILSTGNELQEIGAIPKPGHVYDSNKITLLMLLKEYGYDAKDLGIVNDDEKQMIKTIHQALAEVDVLITTGSVSMGDRDLLKPILENEFHAEIHFGRVNMKPGKPTTFATCKYNRVRKYFMCLPGNPVSATVTAHLFAIPLLNRLSANKSKPTIVKAQITSPYKLDPRPEYARVILDWQGTDMWPQAITTGNQISSKLLSCQKANALLILPGYTQDRPELKKGDVVDAMLLGFNGAKC